MNTASPAPYMIAGYTVEHVAAGQHKLGAIHINESITVVFGLPRDNNGGGAGDEASCLTCQISHVADCAKLVCPDIKKHDPEASCADAIRECMRLACTGSCSLIAGGGTRLIVLA